MSKMDDEFHPEGDVYVEDEISRVFMTEIINQHGRDITGRVEVIPYGAASVGQALGQMLTGGRFKRPTRIFLDGDQASAQGAFCAGRRRPGKVVMEGLRAKQWGLLGMRINRTPTEVSDAFTRAMTSADHHDWIFSAATALQLGTDALWQALCSFWSVDCLSESAAALIVNPIRESLPQVASGPISAIKISHETFLPVSSFTNPLDMISWNAVLGCGTYDQLVGNPEEAERVHDIQSRSP